MRSFSDRPKNDTDIWVCMKNSCYRPKKDADYLGLYEELADQTQTEIRKLGL